MTPRIWKFPLVALALSPREVGFVAAMGPMRIDAVHSWSVRHVAAGTRRRFLENRILRAVEKFEPETLLVTHGSQWRMSERLRSGSKAAVRALGLRSSFLDLEDACDILVCPRTLRAAAERLVAWHPELERHLRPALATKVDPGALRDVRPVLSALTVAHAASVRHVIKFG